jgi:regulator of sigma E protease
MTTVIATIFVLGILIFFHELGHFVVAKKSGIRVDKFSLGFPPKMIGKKIGDTEYCVSWIPLGGYVKMAGEDPYESKIEGKPYEFASKPVGIRAMVIAAGPVMNFLLAIFIFWGIIFFRGNRLAHYDSTEVGSVTAGDPADKAGIQVGDRIVAVNGVEVDSFLQMARIIYPHVEEPVEVKWVHDGQEFTADITTSKVREVDQNGEMKDLGRIGIGPSYTTIKVGFFKSIAGAVDMAWFILVESAKFLFGFFTGTSSVRQLGGPLFIAQTAGETARLGFISLLSFMALLSVNLSLINILPIPVLDGGHLLFLCIEKIKGSPLSLKQRATMQQIGLAFLILIIILVTYNDLLRTIR